MSRSVSNQILNLRATDILCRRVNSWTWALILTLTFSFNVFCFTEIFFLVDEALVFLIVWIACWLFKIIDVLCFFVNAFVRSSQRMGFGFLGRSVIEGCAFVNSIFVDCPIGSLSHFLGYAGDILFNTIGGFFCFDKTLRRSEWIFQGNHFLIALLILLIAMKLLYKLVNQAPVVFQRKFLIIVNWNANFIPRLDNFILTVKLFQVRVLQNFKHCQSFLWVKLQCLRK